MTHEQRTMHEINRDGHAALVRELGVVGALRFIGQFTSGHGDYTRERTSYLGAQSLEELYEELGKIDEARDA
ncbi:MAG: hypothetical protein AAGI71_17550 [Bacteroidota bacterium]